MREYWVLTCLVDSDAASQSALSETLAIDASDMVRLIDSLEKRGWAKRERDPRDRRRQIVSSTKKGTKAQAELAGLVADAESAALGRRLRGGPSDRPFRLLGFGFSRHFADIAPASRRPARAPRARQGRQGHRRRR